MYIRLKCFHLTLINAVNTVIPLLSVTIMHFEEI